MTIRKFVDAKGVEWSVWSTVPAPDSPLARYHPAGWLTFDAGGATLRRLSPAPAGWEAVADQRLELMCRVAEEVPRHTGERLKMKRPEPEAAPGPEPAADQSGRDDGGDREPGRGRPGI